MLFWPDPPLPSLVSKLSRHSPWRTPPPSPDRRVYFFFFPKLIPPQSFNPPPTLSPFRVWGVFGTKKGPDPHVFLKCGHLELFTIPLHCPELVRSSPPQPYTSLVFPPPFLLVILFFGCPAFSFPLSATTEPLPPLFSGFSVLTLFAFSSGLVGFSFFFPFPPPVLVLPAPRPPLPRPSLGSLILSWRNLQSPPPPLFFFKIGPWFVAPTPVSGLPFFLNCHPPYLVFNEPTTVPSGSSFF